MEVNIRNKMLNSHTCWLLGKVLRLFGKGVCGSSRQLAGTISTYPKQLEQIVDSASPHMRWLSLVFTEIVAFLVTCGYENFEILWIFLFKLEKNPCKWVTR